MLAGSYHDLARIIEKLEWQHLRDEYSTFSFQLKPGLHVMSAFAFSFDMCRHVLENANIKCKHHHLLLWNSFMTFDANANVDVTCKQRELAKRNIHGSLIQIISMT